MRFGKTTVAVAAALFGVVICVGVFAQSQDGLEALLSDISKDNTDAPATAPEAAAPESAEAPAPEAVPAPASPEAVLDITTPAEAPTPDVPVEAPAAESPAIMPDVAVPAPEALPSAPEEETAELPITEPAPTEEAPVAQPAEAVMDQPVSAEQPIIEEVQPDAMAPAAVVTEEPAAAEVVQEPAPAEPAVVSAEEVPEDAPATEKDAKALSGQEEVRRQAAEIQAMKSLESGYQALNLGDFNGAVKEFENTLANLPERPATLEAREKAKWGLAEANYRLAADLFRRKSDMQQARQLTEKAIRTLPGHKPALALLRKIEKAELRAAKPVPLDERPDIVEKTSSIEKMLLEGKEYYKIGDYNHAEALFEKVLIQDEYNIDAMRFLKKIDEKRFDLSTKEREATVASMIQKVRDSWNPPVMEEVELPQEITERSAVEKKTSAQRLQDKMAKIMIPSIEFRQANITDVINFLVEASIAGDEEKMGVNIILNMSIPGAEEGVAAAPAAGSDMGLGLEGDDFLGGDVGAAPAAGSGSSIRTITLNLRRISLLDAIKYITEVAGLKFRMEDNAVIITPANVASGRVITRMYPVQPSILDVIIEKEEKDEDRGGDFQEMGGSRTTMKRGDVKEFFEKAGVPFPVGTSITFNQTISQLIVANTVENLEIFERILAQLNVVPNQVEIEARFVEVGQDDLSELGLQWIMTDNYEFAQKTGSANVGGLERVQVDADSEGFTKGNRSWAMNGTTGSIDPVSAVSLGSGQSVLGDILSISSILTNPQLTVVLQALSQKGGTDLLSAPRVTTKTGVNAQIQVVKEIIYPTEFEVTQPTVQSQGDLVTPPTVTPGSFETREVGVILNVTPTVGPDGYTIDLTMVPEVAELVDWIQYGSEITVETGSADTETGQRQSRTYQFNIPQPVFSSRNVTTSIVIWDGQTVVMGGLMRETMVTIDDKIPILGDIPVLGRLFRSKGEKSEKQNLLIFVTARLVDPAGKPIHKAEAMAMPGGGASATVAEPVVAK